jgi:hypothetical protein
MQSLGGNPQRGRWNDWKGALPVFLLLASLLHAAPNQAPQSSDPVELLKQLDSATLDRTRVYAIRDARITRDRMTLYFNRGFIGLMTKVNGEITGAMFSGEGEILMIPPTQAEKRNLAQFTQAAILEESFSSAYLRFTDRTAEELLAASQTPDPEDPDQPDAFVEQWASVAQTLNFANSARILMDLLGDSSRPYFYARIYGRTLGVFEVVDDERQPEAFSIGSVRKVDFKAFRDLWCSFPTQTSQARMTDLLRGSMKALSYTMDIRIQPDNSLEGRAEIQFESHSASDRIIAFGLSRWLVVSSVEDDRGRSLVVIQDPTPGGAPKLPRAFDQIDVVLPEPHPVGERFRLTFKYHGNVIANVGNGVLYVGARGIWYPNLEFGEPALFDLTFHYPEKLTLVATGARIEEKSAAGYTESRWRSDGVFRVAGFNLGPYTSVQRRAGKTHVAVYATREAESALEKHRRVELGPPVLVHGVGREMTYPTVIKVPEHLAPSAFLDHVADLAAEAVEYYSSLFGPFPYPRLAISQMPGNFGQGWPELVYLPTLAFIPKSDRTEMGLSKASSSDSLGPVIVAHEIAHQWWGNLLGWETYHDQWLSEGLASYAAALFVARLKDGDREFRDLLRLYKDDMLAKTPEGKTIESGGPIWLGQRLTSSLDPEGYPNIVYKKACWVLHMLRGLMSDPKTGSDERFFRMLRDFVSEYQGQSVSTEDFIHHAEKYMTPQSDLDKNHKLDWFFSEWVYETGIPTYHLDTNVRRLAADKYLVQGSITQSDVPGGFEMLVPLVAIYGKDKRVTLGRVAVSEDGGRFRFTTTRKPSRVAIDEENLLAVVH